MGDAAARLLECWRDLARHLADRASDPDTAARSQWLQYSIIALMESSEPIARQWLAQAQALSAWHDEPRSVTLAGPRWEELARRSDTLRQRVAAALTMPRGGIFGRKPQKDTADLAAELDLFLRECQAAFGHLAEAPVDTPNDALVELERRIDAGIEQLPPTWPPVVLSAFHAQVNRLNTGSWAALFPRARQRLDERHDAWLAELDSLGCDWPTEAREAAVGLRALLDLLTESEASPSLWSEYAVLQRELLAPFGLQGELIRDPRQPMDWFDAPTETDVPGPTVTRVGLALRQPPGAWIGFPRGQLAVPLPLAISPGAEAVAQLRAIVAARDGWEAFAAPIDALEAATANEAAAAINALSAALANIAADEVPANQAGDLQTALSLARQWAESFGLAILPRRWRFDRGHEADAIPEFEASQTAAFFPTVPARRVARVTRFGLARGGDVLRRGEIVISAGPPPEEFDALLALADGGDIAAELQTWPLAALNGSLEVVAVQFYVDFWDRHADSWHQRDPATASEFANRLGHLLQQALGLFPFHPHMYQDFPDGWLQRVAGRMVTGRVRRVRRPGLQDGQNQLRLPALVEVE